MFGDFWQAFGLNFPFFGADRAGGLFGGTFKPEDQIPGPAALQQQGGFAGAAGPAGGPQMPVGKPGAAEAMARPAPTGAAVAQPPMASALGGSPLAPRSPLAPKQQMAGHLYMPGVEDMMPWQSDQQQRPANENLPPPGYKPGPQQERPYRGFPAPRDYEG